MDLSTNIANLIDNYSGIFTFGVTYNEEFLLNILLEDVFSKIKTKELKEVDTPESYNTINYNFKNKVFIIDSKLITSPKNFTDKRVFAEQLNQFCSENNK